MTDKEFIKKLSRLSAPVVLPEGKREITASRNKIMQKMKAMIGAYERKLCER